MFRRTGALRCRKLILRHSILILIAAIYIAAGFSQIRAGADDSSSFSFGFAERVRQSYISNGFDLNGDGADDWNFIRVRSQLWGSWRHNAGIEIRAGVNNEHRHWFKSTRGYEDQDFEIDELVFENLYISADRIAGSAFSVKAGRQNIGYGEGFLMLDGGPMDGSRTRYFNALLLKAGFEKRELELHVLSDPSWDRYLPVLNSQYRSLIEKDETGAGLYYIDDSFTDMKIESYYFFKREEFDGGGDDDIHTAGTRVSGKVSDAWSYAAELAFQLGDMGDADRKGFGGYAHADYTPDLRMSPALSAGVIYLSGDDPGTDDFEGWNPLYSRWPKWSDLYIYTLASLGRGVAYWENLASAHLSVSVKPNENTGISGSFYYMSAPEESGADQSGGGAYGEGSELGLLSILKFNWNYTEYLSGHLLWERFYPGDYYFEDADPADFLRFQLYFMY